MRLNKFLAEAGISSRRGADAIIKSGKVKVNGKIVLKMGTTIIPEKDKVSVDGKLVSAKPRIIIYLLNKPKGIVTTAHDPEGKKTVIDLVPKEPRVFPCGRLDADTMGLVLLTNDGNLCYQLTHPKFEHKKEYLVEGHCKNPQKAVESLKTGIKLADGPAKVDDVQILKASGDKVKLLVTIHEGRNRIIRRMCAAVGIELIHITRTKLSHYELGEIPPGKYILFNE